MHLKGKKLIPRTGAIYQTKFVFSKFTPEKNNLWIPFSFISMSTFRLESIVAKSDYWLAILLCLIIVLLFETLKERIREIRLQYLKLILTLNYQ